MGLDTGIRQAILQGRPPAPAELDDLVAAEALRLGRAGAGEVRAALGAALLGAGPLEPHLEDPLVTDVLVNGDGAVWLDRGTGLQRAPGDPLGAESARMLAVRLAGQAGRRLDESQPWVDGLLPGGVRLHAVLPPLVDGGAHLSLRVPRRSLRRLDDLESARMFDEPTGRLLRRLVERRVSFLVTGGTGSGKTTLLGALLAEASADERLVLVEDVRELAVEHPHVVRLQSRSANVEGAGEVTLVDLVRQALRMRPDRLVVGEVRGAEVRELLAALNTGHDGGCGTVHANSAADVVPRFEALGALAGLGRDAVQAQLSSAVQAVVHLRRDRAVRRVASLSVLETGSGLEVALALYCASTVSGAVRGPGWPRLAALLGLPS
ncbi:TadA family conjugal transfer-associated ATPase [Knoellia sp. 3-2P3]|uniref:TadA family conjugal transfer-associated ATPase n=1 Tax=unclassified Knoellia TaxID=2618719 RepID=UPI0023D9BAF8|nr:TadA family conjugal transfer-associated ATPase [Knoellia sp. 3-2P3]MDF2090899.1 TadA family conjugal transfer-associated ATPase [Knoellia sp. 3-2P3]